MTDIMHSIYDMMGKYTYPNMRDSAPREHVDTFFQVKPLECQRQDVKQNVDELGNKGGLEKSSKQSMENTW